MMKKILPCLSFFLHAALWIGACWVMAQIVLG